MKLLYICHALQNTGWGRAARENILALDSVGVDVVWRPIKLNSDNYKPTGRFLELFEKDIDEADYCIQHILPNYLTYNSCFKKNIAYFVAETLDWHWSGFHHNINLLDELWCPNNEMAENAKRFIKIPIRVVPHPCDIEKYKQQYKKIEIPELESSYNFYTIAEWNKRKRIGALIQAFNLEFKKSEPVNLIIKTNKTDVNPQKLAQEIQTFSQQIKVATKLYKDDRYPNEVIISHFMTEEEILGLHETCHCFVNTSYGEAWSYPVFDAMAMGSMILSTDCGGPKDFLSRYSEKIMIYGEYKPVFGMDKENFSNYNSSRERWMEIDIDSLRCAMRKSYENNYGVEKKTSSGLEIAKEDYSREVVGNLMKELLC